MITYLAAARTAKHWDKRGEYARADAILLLIKANLPDNESRILGAVERADSVIDSGEIARRAAVAPLATYTALRRLQAYGLITRLERTPNTVGRSFRWTAVRWQAVRFTPPRPDSN